MFNNLFNKKYDDKIVLIHSGKPVSFGELKKCAFEKAKLFAKEKQRVVFLGGKDNYCFIVDFLAAVLSGKEIFLTDENAGFEGDIEFVATNGVIEEEDFDSKNIIINLCTSGSQGEAKSVKKSLYNLIREAEDIGKTFFENEKDLRFLSTTTLNHLFGLTFHFMTPFVNGFVIDTKMAAYPENVDFDNAVLVTSPSFLEKVQKYCSDFKINPKYIIAAGAKLKDDVFGYFEKKSNVIEIYGSTETGVIAHRESSESKYLTKFENVQVAGYKDNIMTIKTDYGYDEVMHLSDNIDFCEPDKISVLSRTDRIMKIGEKRISPQKIEKALKNSPFVEEVLCLKIGEKLAAAVVLNDDGKNSYIEIGQLGLIKKLKTLLSDKFEIIPQKWRFLPEIYKNRLGKIDKEKIESIFAVNLSFPLILSQNTDYKTAEIELIFPKHSNFFQGHFKNFPIVPGVVELYFALFFAKTAFNNEDIVPQVIKKIKYSHIIKPDEKVTFYLQDKEKSIDFTIKTGDNICSSGVFSKSSYFDIK